jgi:hypothetical protein
MNNDLLEAPLPVSRGAGSSESAPGGDTVSGQTGDGRARDLPGVRDTLFALLTLFAGYLFVRLVPVSDSPFGGLLFTLFLFLFGAVWLRLSGGRQSVLSVAVAASACIMSAGFFLTGNGTVHTCIMLWAVSAWTYWIYLSTGNSIAPLGGLTAADFVKAAFVMPWASPAAFGRAVFGRRGDRSGLRKAGMAVLWISLGLAVALLPTLIIIKVLRYDPGFSDLVMKLGSLRLDLLLDHAWSLVLAVPVAFYVFGGMISCGGRKLSGAFTGDQVRGAAGRIRVFPKLMCVFSVAPLICVYLLFFVSQRYYYLSAFTGSLPEGLMSYSEYARSGFFELCGVSAFNAFVMLLVTLFMKRDGDRPSPAQRAVSGMLCCCTLVLIATALAKMFLYIDRFGLTQKRVYTTWFMVLLAFGFIAALVRQIAPRFNAAGCFICVFAVMLAGLALSGVDGRIADYNADRYISGELADFDAAAMEELGDDAVPAVIRVARHLEEQGFSAGDCDLASAASGGDGPAARMLKEHGNAEKTAAVNRAAERAASGGSLTKADEAACRVYGACLEAVGRYASRDAEGGLEGLFSLTLPRVRARRELIRAAQGS